MAAQLSPEDLWSWEDLSLGQRIKKVREIRNYTQEHMAEELGMSPSGYGRVERDEVSPTLGRLEKIADILKVSLPKLVGTDEKMIFNEAVGFVNSTTGNLDFENINNSGDNKALKNLYEELKTAHLAQVAQLQEENKHLKETISFLQEELRKKG